MKHVMILAAWAAASFLGSMAWGQQTMGAPPATAPASLAILPEKGIYTEETIGDLDAAIAIYKQVVDAAQANRTYAAQAQYRLAMCHLKKGDKAKAARELRTLLTSYPQEKAVAAQAQRELVKLVPAADAAPRVIATSPAAMADDVDPSLDKITVTFDQEMRDGGWAWIRRYPDKYPKTTGDPSYDAEHRTCTLPMQLQPGHVYYIEFNSAPYIGFRSVNGQPSERHALVFATRSAEGKPTPLPEDLVRQVKEINAAPQTQPAEFPEIQGARLVETLSMKLLPKEQAYASAPQQKKIYEFNALRLSWTMPPEMAAKAKYLTILASPIAAKEGADDQYCWLVINMPAGQANSIVYGQDLGGYTVTPAKELKPGQYTVVIAAYETPQTKKDLEAMVGTAMAQVTVQPMALLQAGINDIDAGGTIHFHSIANQINDSHQTMTQDQFINSDFVEVKSMTDGDGKPMAFDVEHKDNHYHYTVKFNKPVAPGEAVLGSCDGTIRGLVKQAGNTFTYYMCHSPSAPWETRRIEVYRLPAGAEVLETTPADMARRTQNGRVELYVEKMIPVGGSITTAFTYRLARSSSEPAASGAAEAAEPAARQWLKLVDEQQYDKAYNQAAGFFRKAVAMDVFVAGSKSAREPVGKIESRKLLSAVYMTQLPGAPDGQYVVIQYQTSFENKKDAVETITPMKDSDDEWRVSGYFIK